MKKSAIGGVIERMEAASAGFVSVTASFIQDVGGNRLAAGTVEVLPTDGSNTPITAAAGGGGGQMSSRTPAVFTVNGGVLQAGAQIADTTQTLPPNICYRFTIKDATGTPISVIKLVQTAANAPFNLDTYQPNVAPQALVQKGPQGLSAYDLWVAAGNTGTQTDFFASLVGPVSPLQLGTNRDLATLSQRNVFDPTRITPGSIIAFASGDVFSHPAGSYFLTGYMPVTPGTSYVASLSSQLSTGYGWAFYDAAQNFLSGVAGVAAGSPVTVPANALYARVAFGNDSAGAVPGFAASLMVVQGTALPVTYRSFGSIDPTSALTQAFKVKDATKVASICTNLFDQTQTTVGAVNNAGVITPVNSTFFVTNFMLVAGLASIISNTLMGVNDAGYFGMAFYDIDKNLLSGNPGAPAGTAMPVFPGAVYARGFFSNASSPNGVVVIPGTAAPSAYTPYVGLQNAYDQVTKAAVLDASLNPSRNLFNPAAAVVGTISSSTGALDPTSHTNFYTSDFIYIAPGSQFVIGVGISLTGYAIGIAFYDPNRNFVSGVANGYPGGTAITMPANAVCMRFSMLTLSSQSVYRGSTVPVTVFGQDLVTSSRWFGKNYGCVGDSITAYGQPGIAQYSGYQVPVCSKLGMNLKLSNGVSGKCMVDFLTLTDYTSATNQTTVQALDILSFFLGTNDFGTNVPLGAMGDTTAATFFGAVWANITTVMGWKPTLKLLFFTPLIRAIAYTPNSVGHTLEDYVNAIKQVCGHFGIPVGDLFHGSGFNTLNIPSYTDDQLLHPNSSGYDNVVTPFMVSFIKNL